MRATINVSSNIAGMGFGISWRRHHANPASVSAAGWAIQDSPNMCSRSCLRHGPAVAFRVPDSFPNVFVWMIGHFRACASCFATMSTIPLHPSAAKSNGHACPVPLLTASVYPHGRAYFTVARSQSQVGWRKKPVFESMRIPFLRPLDKSRTAQCRVHSSRLDAVVYGIE